MYDGIKVMTNYMKYVTKIGVKAVEGESSRGRESGEKDEGWERGEGRAGWPSS